MSAGAQPAYSLLAQAGARSSTTPAAGIFVPTRPPGRRRGRRIGHRRPASASRASSRGEARQGFVCICEDLTDEGSRARDRRGLRLARAREALHDRDDGALPGPAVPPGSVRLYARETGTDEAAIGTTTARPPWSPVPLGLLAGRGREPASARRCTTATRSSARTMMWTGAWRRAPLLRRPGRRGARGARVARPDRRLDAREARSSPGPTPSRSSTGSTRTASRDLKLGRVRYGVLDERRRPDHRRRHDRPAR